MVLSGFESELAALFEAASTLDDDLGVHCDLALGGSGSSQAGPSSNSAPLRFVAASPCIVGTVPGGTLALHTSVDDVESDRQRVYKSQPLWRRAFNDLGITRFHEPEYDPRAVRIYRQQGLSSIRPALPR